MQCLPLKKRPFGLTPSEEHGQQQQPQPLPPAGDPLCARPPLVANAPSGGEKASDATDPCTVAPAAEEEDEEEDEVEFVEEEADDDDAALLLQGVACEDAKDPIKTSDLAGEWVVSSNGECQVGTARVTFNEQLTTGRVWFCDAVTRQHSLYHMKRDPNPLCQRADLEPLVILDPKFSDTHKYWTAERWGENIAWRAQIKPTLDPVLGWMREAVNADPDFQGMLVWSREPPAGATVLGSSSSSGNADPVEPTKRPRRISRRAFGAPRKRRRP